MRKIARGRQLVKLKYNYCTTIVTKLADDLRLKKYDLNQENLA